jgi:hypothetical protein
LNKCDEPDCRGEPIKANLKCFRHADDVDRAKYLSDDTVQFISLRGVVVTQQVWDNLINSSIFVDKTSIRPIHFNHAVIDAEFDLSGYTFDKPIYFTYATIKHRFTFYKCTFVYLNAAFAFFDHGSPMFSQCRFLGEVIFAGAKADGVSIGFSQSEFAWHLVARRIEANFNAISCRFRDFDMSSASGPFVTLRRGCSIEGELNLAGARFSSLRTASLRVSTAQQIGPFSVERDCRLERAQFGARVRLEVTAKHLDMSGTQLMHGGHISLGGGTVDLSQVSTGRSLRISGLSESKEVEILRLQNTDVGSMSFAYVDMSRCVFHGSHNLGEATIEPTVGFARAPRWYARRRCVADEFAWRGMASRWCASRWRLSRTRLAQPVNEEAEEESRSVALPTTLHASQVAAVYRALRRSFEARADAPAAADFYYGEMEMRRHDRESNRAERCIVWLYWMFSGYGLRASRAFAWLAVLTVVGTLVAANRYCLSFVEGLIFSLYALLPGLQPNEALPAEGQFLNIVLTVLGPVLLALAVLALRGRVKR